MYSDEELISELHRFVSQHGYVPTAGAMDIAIGYPSSHAYLSHFETWNIALESAGLPINRRYLHITGNTKCVTCGVTDSAKWYHNPDGDLICSVCRGQLRSDYTYGQLDPNSNVGIGLTAEKIVSKALGISTNNHCNIEYGFNHAYDLYSDVLGTINVKSSTLRNGRWAFNLRNSHHPDTYIFVAFSEDRRNIEHVWIVPSYNTLVNGKIGISVQDSGRSLSRMKGFAQYSVEYNAAYHSMSLDKCPYMGQSTRISSSGVEVQA